jgi:hypothetical protein
MFVKVFKHFKFITRHRYEVFKVAWIAGIKWRGFIHDISKYSLSEFVPSVKYFNGKISPIDLEKKDKGYSFAWLHHRGMNPHHWEYWIDNLSSGGEALRIPYEYNIEMICDWIGYGKAYLKDSWSFDILEKNFLRKLEEKEFIMHPKTLQFTISIIRDFTKNGYEALNKDHTKILYKIIGGYHYESNRECFESIREEILSKR